jgi:hypothetical protein
MLRYSLLRQFGGVYFDIDWLHLSRLPDQPDNGLVNCVAIHNKTPVNAAMACRPGLAIFDLVAEIFTKHKNMAYMTGSHSLRRALKRQPEAFGKMAGNFTPDLRENLNIYCREHGIDIGGYYGRDDYGDLTAVHLSTHGAITDAEQVAMAKRINEGLAAFYN